MRTRCTGCGHGGYYHQVGGVPGIGFQFYCRKCQKLCDSTKMNTGAHLEEVKTKC